LFSFAFHHVASKIEIVLACYFFSYEEQGVEKKRQEIQARNKRLQPDPEGDSGLQILPAAAAGKQIIIFVVILLVLGKQCEQDCMGTLSPTVIYEP